MDEEAGRIFCLAEGPDKDTVDRVHQEAHGLRATAICQVTEHS